MTIDQIHAAILSHLDRYPDARFLSDTQLVLDPAAGNVMNIQTLLDIISAHPGTDPAVVIDDYVTALLRATDAAEEGLDRRTVLAGATRLLYPADSAPDWLTLTPLVDGLDAGWAIADGDAIATMPAEQILAHATEAELHERARYRIRAYARGVRTKKFLGGVVLEGGRQTSSIPLYLEDCAPNIGLPHSDAGYFIALPDVCSIAIIPATSLHLASALRQSAEGVFLAASKPLTPHLYHWYEGSLNSLGTEDAWVEFLRNFHEHIVDLEITI